MSTCRYPVLKFSARCQHVCLSESEFSFSLLVLCDMKCCHIEKFTLLYNKWNKICFIVISHFNNKHNTRPWSDIRFIALPVLLKAQNLFQNELSRECDIVLPLLNYSVFHFPYSYSVADCVFFLIFPSILSFCQKRILELSYTPGNAISILCDRLLLLYKERKRRRK